MKTRTPTAHPTIPTTVDSSFLQTLVGYNTRRATLRIMELFDARMASLDLNPVEFSVLSLIGRNPGVTPGQLCTELNLLQPNLAKLLARLDARNLVRRAAPASDRRSACLSLSKEGSELLVEAESRAVALELEASSKLTVKQRETLMSLLMKIYG